MAEIQLIQVLLKDKQDLIKDTKELKNELKA
jgi:hypothetical protein